VTALATPRLMDNTLRFAAFWQQRVCASCGEPGTEPHHVVLRSLGGEDHIDNLLLLCLNCHRLFHDGDRYVARWIGTALAEWPEKLAHARAAKGARYLLTYYEIGEDDGPASLP